MHPGLALIAEMSGSLGDFPCLGSNFLGWNTNLGVQLKGHSSGHVHYMPKIMYAYVMRMTNA